MTKKTCALIDHLRDIPDPRRQCANLKHPLESVLVLGFCGALAGCDDFVEIVTWANLRLDFFRTFLDLPNGIPSHDTFSRVFAAVRPGALQAVLLAWLHQRRGSPGKLIKIDGKSMRRTRRNSRQLGALHIVSAWASEAGLTLGQVAVDAKSNEITAIPELIELLDLKDRIVTIDAIGCQKEIAAAIVEQEGDYVLAVKDNQPTLHAEIQAAFATAQSEGADELRDALTFDRGHGRRELRRVWVLPAADYLSAAQLSAWEGLRSLVMVRRLVTHVVSGAQSEEVAYSISSLKPNASRLGQMIRGHWGIENGCHWVLDVVFREDARRVWERTAAQNLAFINRLALSVLRGDTSKDSLKVRRKKAGWDSHYLAQLLGIPNG